jgi:adenosine deaminase
VPDRGENLRDLHALPKAHLHLHLLGALRRSTYRELTARYGVAAPPPSFGEFAAVVQAATESIRSADDVRRVVRETVEDAAADGAVWIEPALRPRPLPYWPAPVEELLDVVLAEGRATGRELGVGFGLVVATSWLRGGDEALTAARLAVSRQAAGVVGFGLDGVEGARPYEEFGAAFTLARGAGLAIVPHVGEFTGARHVADALSVFRADRLMHGVRAVDDAGVVRELVRARVPLDVCPTSNVALAVVPSLRTHPLPALLNAGVRCSVNADDPLPFGTGLLEEYHRCRTEMGLCDRQLAAVARTSIETSTAPEADRRTALAGVDAWAA